MNVVFNLSNQHDVLPHVYQHETKTYKPYFIGNNPGFHGNDNEGRAMGCHILIDDTNTGMWYCLLWLGLRLWIMGHFWIMESKHIGLTYDYIWLRCVKTLTFMLFWIESFIMYLWCLMDMLPSLIFIKSLIIWYELFGWYLDLLLQIWMKVMLFNLLKSEINSFTNLPYTLAQFQFQISYAHSVCYCMQAHWFWGSNIKRCALCRFWCIHMDSMVYGVS